MRYSFVFSSRGKYFVLVGVRHSESKRWSVEGVDDDDDDDDDDGKYGFEGSMA
jgi:hypothetical protein